MGRKPKKPGAAPADEAVVKVPRKRRPRSPQIVIAEHAAAYGINVPSEPSSSERYLSPNDIGKILNVTGEAVKQWIYRRRLPAVKLANGYWKVKVSDFESFLKARHEVGKRQIMITDTSNSDVSDLKQAVEDLGHQPVVAFNYADAILKAIDHFPALFIITLHGDSQESWKVAEKIRGTKSLRSFPILLITERNLNDSETDRALHLYIQGQLTRPFTLETLTKEIDRILQRSV